MKKFSVFFALVLCATALLCGCGETAPTEPSVPATTPTTLPGTMKYEVSVTDALGNPYTSGVIVKFLLDGQQVAMLPVDGNGVAAKELDAAAYRMELVNTGDEVYYYDAEAAVFADGESKLQVILSKTLDKSNATSLYAQGKDHDAYSLSTGCTYVELKAGQRNYFLFTPQEPGMYEVRAIGAGVTVGYYGAPHYVQERSAAEVKDNAFSVSVSADMIGSGNTGTTRLVIGVDADAEGCILAVTRTGNPEVTIADYPWQTYQKTVSLSPYTLPQGAVLQDFDITAANASYDLVLGADGFYHLNTADGPLVLMRLGADSGYMPGYKKVLETTGVVKYFFDENGEFVKKESYSECLLEYIAVMDESGVYPLTEDLKYIIQQNGDHQGWWKSGTSTYLFKDAAGNPVQVRKDLAWLFMCCYIAS